MKLVGQDKTKDKIPNMSGKEHIAILNRYIEILKDEKENVKESYEKRIEELQQNQIETTKRCLEVSAALEKAKEENMELKLLIPDRFPVDEIAKDCAKRAWNGEKNRERIFTSLDKKLRLFFSGTIYEPSYDCVKAGCDIYYQRPNGDKKALYLVDRNLWDHSIKTVKDFIIKQNVGFKEEMLEE